ncbi:MAG: biopolymer transporter ExbD [Cyanobacteria bacterium J06643_4]
MKVDLNNKPSDVQIEILPMIDVIFCILTFFILAAVGLTRQQVIDLTLPSVNNSVPVSGDSRERLYVSVDSAGQVYIDSNAVQLSLLRTVLEQHKAVAPNGTIVLYASSSAYYEDVIQVLDLLRSVGGDRVALATLPSGASLDPTQGNTPNFGNLEGNDLNGLPGGNSLPGGAGFPAQPSPGSSTTPGGGGVLVNPIPGGPAGVPSGTQPGSIPPITSPGSSSAPTAPPRQGSSSTNPSTNPATP